MTAPALIKLGVPHGAAHMFIFYYAVLSEVSPPTAITPFAAAAITGGNPFKTTMLAWKYTLPAFIVPFMFTPHPDGVGLLLDPVLAHDPLDLGDLDDRRCGPGRGSRRLVPAPGRMAGTNAADSRRFDAGLFLLAV